MSAGESAFSAAMQRFGLTGPYEQEHYVAEVQRRFGKAGERFLEAVDAWLEMGCDPEWTASLNERMSVDPELARFVVAHSWSGLYRATGATLLASGLLAGRTVVDFGCGPGLLTLCLAQALPATRFLGVDLPAVVSAAQWWGAKSNQGNVDFVAIDRAAEQPLQDVVVLMHAVTHELWHHPLEAMLSGQPPIQHALELEQIRKWVGERGLVVTVNRFPYPAAQVPCLDAIFAVVGLQPVATRMADAVTVEEPPERLAVRVYGPKS